MCFAPPVKPRYSAFPTPSPPPTCEEGKLLLATKPDRSGPGLGYATSEVWEQYKKQLQVYNYPLPISMPREGNCLASAFPEGTC